MESADKKSFFVFLGLLLCVIATALLNYNAILGLVTLVCGLFGFIRFVYLNETTLNPLPKIFSLPKQILFGAAIVEKEQRHIILKRMVQGDVLAFIFLCFLYLLWSLYTSFFPAEFSLIQNLREEQSQLIDVDFVIVINEYTVLIKNALLATLALFMILAVSYSQNRLYFVLINITLLPIFVMAMLALLLHAQVVNTVMLPALSQWSGIGAGQMDVFTMLLDSYARNIISPLWHRHIEMGAIGMVGPYLVCLPLVFILIKTYRDTASSRLVSFLGLFTAALLIFVDVGMQFSAYTHGFQFLGLVLMAFYWGASVQSNVKNIFAQ